MERQVKLILEMMEYESGCPQRIQHFLKVTAFSEQIGQMENLDERTYLILQTAAVLHDIGIKPSIEKYGSGSGNYQEIEGPPLAQTMLEKLGYDEELIQRVCYLVAHHHTYDHIEGADYQILVEADFLVNIFEHDMARESAHSIREKIFRTQSGKKVFDCLYP